MSAPRFMPDRDRNREREILAERIAADPPLVPPNYYRAGLPTYRLPSSGEICSGKAWFWRGRLWLKEDVKAQIELEEAQRRSLGRPRLRRSRRVLAGWLAKVAMEIQR